MICMPSGGSYRGRDVILISTSQLLFLLLGGQCRVTGALLISPAMGTRVLVAWNDLRNRIVYFYMLRHCMDISGRLIRSRCRERPVRQHCLIFLTHYTLDKEVYNTICFVPYLRESWAWDCIVQTRASKYTSVSNFFIAIEIFES